MEKWLGKSALFTVASLLYKHVCKDEGQQKNSFTYSVQIYLIYWCLMCACICAYLCQYAPWRLLRDPGCTTILWHVHLWEFWKSGT
jgi:hypothetical protein